LKCLDGIKHDFDLRIFFNATKESVIFFICVIFHKKDRPSVQPNGIASHNKFLSKFDTSKVYNRVLLKENWRKVLFC